MGVQISFGDPGSEAVEIKLSVAGINMQNALDILDREILRLRRMHQSMSEEKPVDVDSGINMARVIAALESKNPSVHDLSRDEIAFMRRALAATRLPFGGSFGKEAARKLRTGATPDLPGWDEA